MAGISENQIIKQLNELGKRVLHPPSSISELLNLLDEVEFLFAKMRQAPSQPVQQAFVILKEGLIADVLFKHPDPDVRITVASCLREVTRISAPTPPYEDDKMREIFELIVSSFEYLSSQPGRCYSKAILILQSVAQLRSCVVMLDLDCDALVLTMFELFQKHISPKHPPVVFRAMVKIMSIVIEESDPVSPELLKSLVASIKMENKSVSPASWEMGVKIIEGCTDKLKPFIMETVSSMSGSLEDYAPILSSICKPKEDNEANVVNGSPKPENNEPSDKLNLLAEFVQGLKATESHQTASVSNSGSRAIGTEGTTSKKGKKENSGIFDKEAAAGTDHKQVRQGSAEENTKKKNESPRKEVELKNVKEEPVDFENCSQRNSAAHGNSNNKKDKPAKKVVPGISGDRSLKKNNDVSGVSSSSGKKLVRPLKESSGVSANKNKSSQSGKMALTSSGSSKNLRKRASSDDDVIETPHGRKNYKEDLVGSRIKVWWPLDRRYYEGTITSYDASIRKHRVDYDDGDEEILNLRKEQWEFLGDETPTEIVMLLEKKTPHPPSSTKAQPKAPTVEKTKKNDEKGRSSTPEVKPSDARDHLTPTADKSEIPETLHETKRPRSSDKSEIPETLHETKRPKSSDELNS